MRRTLQIGCTSVRLTKSALWIGTREFAPLTAAKLDALRACALKRKGAVLLGRRHEYGGLSGYEYRVVVGALNESRIRLTLEFRVGAMRPTSVWMHVAASEAVPSPRVVHFARPLTPKKRSAKRASA